MPYDIQSWNSILNDCALLPRPFIYVKPDLDFLEFTNRNRNRVRVKISGTDNVYSGHTYWGHVREAAFEAGCRPNFYLGTQFYAIELDSFWFGYPSKMGQMEFVKGPVNFSTC